MMNKNSFNNHHHGRLIGFILLFLLTLVVIGLDKKNDWFPGEAAHHPQVLETIVQESDSASMAFMVEADGGTLTHVSGIIDAAGADIRRGLVQPLIKNADGQMVSADGRFETASTPT